MFGAHHAALSTFTGLFAGIPNTCIWKGLGLTAAGVAGYRLANSAIEASTARSQVYGKALDMWKDS